MNRTRLEILRIMDKNKFLCPTNGSIKKWKPVIDISKDTKEYKSICIELSLNMYVPVRL